MKTYLNDLGIVCALGEDKTQVLKKFIENDQSTMQQSDEFGVDTFIGKINTPLSTMTQFPAIERSRNNQLALHAFQQIEATLLALKEKIPHPKIAVVIGTSTSGIASGEISMQAYLETGEHQENYHYSMQEMGATADFIAKLAGATSCCYAISTACTSSAKAIISGHRLLDSGLADIVIAGGVDSLCRLTINGFNSLESISQQKTIPFEKDRNGINIGEGAALFILSNKSADIALTGFGETSDAYHISAPHPEGIGAIAAMKQALSRSKIQPKEIDYINLHGTGTVQNDAMEANAVNHLFGDKTPCSPSKHLHGHCLGAAGAIEAGLCWLLLSNLNHEEKYPKLDISCKIAADLPQINLLNYQIKQPKTINYCMSNSYAFGGNNASLILARNHVRN